MRSRRLSLLVRALGTAASAVILVLIGTSLINTIASKRQSRLEALALPDLLVESLRSPRDPAVGLHLARRYLSYGEVGTAEAAIRHSLQLQPSAEAYRELGAVLASMDRYEEALIAFSESLRRQDRDPETYRLRGWLYVGRQQYAQAARDMTRARELSPDNPQIQLQAARVYLSARMDELSREALNAYLALRPRDAEGHALLGGAHLEFGRLDQAESTLKRALRYDRRNGLAHQALARLYLKRGQVAGNLSRALRHLESALSAEPRDPELLHEFGQLLLRLNQAPQAIGYLERSVSIMPDHRTYYTLGTAYQRAGKAEKARVSFEQESKLRAYRNEVIRLQTVLQAKPDDFPSRLELARAHRRVGRIAEAGQQLQIIIASSSDASIRMQAEEELKALSRAGSL